MYGLSVIASFPPSTTGETINKMIPLYTEAMCCKNSPLTLSTNYICYNYNCCCIDVTKKKSFSLCKFLLPNEKNAGSFFVITASEWREALTYYATVRFFSEVIE